MNKYKYVILTNFKSTYGLKLLNNLNRLGETPEQIYVCHVPISNQFKLLISLVKRIGLLSTIYSVMKFLKIKKANSKLINWRGERLIEEYERLGKNITYVDNFNDSSTVDKLKKLDCDFIVLAQTGIVKNSLIKAAKKGVLNAHPGKLPQYRGVDIPWWTLFEKKFSEIGSTLHFVDKGVDTGEVIRYQPYIHKDKVEFDFFEERLYDDCVDLLTNAILDIRKDEIIKGTPQNKLDGKQYYKMDFFSYLKTKKIFKEFINN